MQVVLSVGRNVNPGDLERIPPNTIVVRIAPQIELLKRAALCITHAGLNTALEALAQGVPMAAIPIGYDQPGVAARIAYHGVVKKQQMQWTLRGAHLLLQTRTRVLNEDLDNVFRRCIRNSGRNHKRWSKTIRRLDPRLIDALHKNRDQSRLNWASQPASDSMETAPILAAHSKNPVGGFLTPKTFASFISAISCQLMPCKSVLRRSALPR
jgi:UDP-glucoronosyl and UDP-glucosyl transferase